MPLPTISSRLPPSSRQLFEQREESMIFRPLYGYSKVHPAHPAIPRMSSLLMSLYAGIKAKVENKMQYDEYLKDLEPLREELGVDLKENLYPE